MDEFLNFIGNYYILIVRFILPVLALLLLGTCAAKLFVRKKTGSFARLIMQGNRTEFPINGMENSVGRSKMCDIVLAVPTVSRRHAVIYWRKGYWWISDIGSTGGILLNGEAVKSDSWLEVGDEIEMGGVKFALAEGKGAPPQRIKPPKSAISQLFLLTLFQILAFFSFVFHYKTDFPVSILGGFCAVIAAEWVYCSIRRFRGNIQIELLGFFLTTIGICVASSALPSSVLKQVLCFLMGFAAFIILNLILKEIDLTMKMRYFMGGAAILALAANLIFAKEINGARNWIDLGFFTVQPSELVKIAFIFTGAATLEHLLTTRNLILFLGFSGACIGALFIMRDFGTASIYFVTMLVLAYMRSGDLRAIAAIGAAAVVGAGLIIYFKPYVADRFAAYRHAWDLASGKGYQQTRTMMAIGSGGLFGLGGGEGNLDRVAAADTDLVFGLICEEWGLIIGLVVVFCFVLFAIYAFRCTPKAYSSYYAISACAAASMFLFQVSLNLFGSTDLLPLTGVTLPFVSNGGSSMIASWAILSFIKAVGERNVNAEEV